MCVIAGVISLFESGSFWESFVAIYAIAVGVAVFIVEVSHTRTLLHRVDSSLPWCCIELRTCLVEETPFHPSLVRSLLFFVASLTMFTSFSILIWPGLHLVVAAALYLLDAVAQPVRDPIDLNAVGEYLNVDNGAPPGPSYAAPPGRMAV